MIDVGIVGASGYTGLELLRILAGHPEVRVTTVTSRSLAGQKVTDVFPALSGRPGGLDEMVFEAPVPEDLVKKAQVLFTAVPHRTAMEMVPTLVAGGAKVVDLSADFRFDDPAVYGQWYQPHLAPDLLAQAVYGLPELHRDQLKKAQLVGNPGCYPTSVILAAAPLVKNGLIDPDTIIADSKSGVSGAGRGLSMTSQFCEINDGIMAYKVTGHRHTPEMEQEISHLADRPCTITFTPHLVPFSRGILSTVYAPLLEKTSRKDLEKVVQDFYQGETFIRIRTNGVLPHTLDVRGTNFCDLGVFLDERKNTVKMIAVIDNLARGASAQAVCNMNIVLGLPEETGLTQLGLRP